MHLFSESIFIYFFLRYYKCLDIINKKGFYARINGFMFNGT